MNNDPLALLAGTFKGSIAQLNLSLTEEGLEVKQIGPRVLISEDCDDYPALIFLEITGEDKDYLTIFRKIKQKFPSTPVILFSPFSPADSKEVSQLIKEGVYEHLREPFDVDEVMILVRRALRENMQGQKDKQSRKSFSSLPANFILGKNPEIKEVIRLVREVAPTDLTVFIHGESGTGKDMVASIIHELSGRKGKPFLRLNCAALTETIMESELFGYERGAFTGAEAKKKGLFSAAQGGTLLLDEIGEASLTTQVKLLRVIEDKEFIPVGGTSPVKCDVRLIVATNKDLKKEIKGNRFRPDLYYRINIFSLYLPPLRERREDIPIFVKHYLKKHCFNFNKQTKKISPLVYDFLLNYSWPGNIRELEATMLKMVVASRGPVISLKDVEQVLPREEYGMLKHSLFPYEKAKRRYLRSFEKQYIKDLLIRCKGNVTRAAKQANVTRSFIYKKVREYGMELSSYRRITSFIS